MHSYDVHIKRFKCKNIKFKLKPNLRIENSMKQIMLLKGIGMNEMIDFSCTGIIR